MDREVDIEALIEASSLGTPEAKAARESVPHSTGVAIALAAKYLGRAEAAERRAAALEAAVLPLARECQGLVSKYTRAPGANGDRVADLLSEDTYRIGTAILAALSDSTDGQRPTSATPSVPSREAARTTRGPWRPREDT